MGRTDMCGRSVFSPLDHVSASPKRLKVGIHRAFVHHLECVTHIEPQQNPMHAEEYASLQITVSLQKVSHALIRSRGANRAAEPVNGAGRH